MQQTHKHRPKGKKRTKPISRPHTSGKTRFQETGDPTIVIHQYTKRLEWTSSESAMRCDDIEDMTLKCHVRRQDTLQFIKGKGHPGPWPLAPGPWPSILVPLLPNRCSEQAAASSSKQQAEAATESRQQQKAAGRIGATYFSHFWKLLENEEAIAGRD